MASSEVEMSSCQTFNCVLSPHERCIRGDNNKKNKNKNNVRNIHVAFEKNLKVFVRDPLENCTVVSGENCHDNSTKSVPECSSNSKSSLSDHRLPKTDEAPSSSPLGSDPDPNFNNPGQPDKRKETRAASCLVQIWEARTTQHPNQNQSLIDSRTSSGSIVLEYSESLNEPELIQTIEEGNNEEEEEEEKMECETQLVPPQPDASGEKEREGVRVMDIIRKLSTDSETTANHENGSSSNDNAKDIQTTEARSFPQVACSPRIRGRQAFADLLVQMTRDREKELASLSERHSVSKFTHRGRIQSTLRIRCYERCIAIQDRHRSKTSDLNRSPRGSGVMHLLREKYKTNSENIESGVLSISRGRSLDKDAPKVAEKKVLQETMEKKSDIKEIQEVVSAVETVKKAVLSESTENKIGFKKSSGETIQKETGERRGQKQETNVKAIAKETVKKAVFSENAENKKPAGETIQKESREGRGEKREMKEKESVQGKALMGIAEKVNLWNSEEKINRRKGKAKTERVEKNIEVLEEAARRIINVESAERSIATSKETIKRCEFAEEVVRRTKKEDPVSVETKSKETVDRNINPQQVNAQAEEKVLQETRANIEARDNKNGLRKPNEEESVDENSMMGIAEKVNMWNSKERRNRRNSIDRGKANAKTNQVLQEASRRITNVETAERSITTSKENVERVVGNKETKQCESEDKGRRKKEEDLGVLEAKSKEIIEVKNMIPQEVSSHDGSRERAKEIINSSQHGEVISVLRNPEAKSTKEIERNDVREIVIEEASASDGSRVRAKESEDEVTKEVDLEENVQETAIEHFSVWEENEVEEEEDEYGDYDHYSGDYSYDWVNDISRPRSYWEDLRKERYLEVLNAESEKKDICNLIQRRTVSDFLTSDLRQKIDNLMISRVQNHIRVPVNQEEGDEDEEEEEWEEECSPRNQEDNETEEEPEKTNLEDASDNFSQSSVRSSTLMMSWSFRDHDIDKDQEPTTSLSLPEPPVPTNQPTQEMQMISDLRGQMEQMQREMLELRNTVKSCIDMQLHFQKSVVQDFSRSGSSAEQRVETKKDPLQRKCCVCLEMPVDSLLYRCGHMCTCLKCAHELQWSSKKCPICMAPIVDVVRAFLDF
ncbi:unnamed protein product [Microthlaspi erraticum]|uniref:RING-type domain-containing protein n=1 Tax=Microthlaspi erraticum TaxID=1685480 RepID=A0A6D2I6V7_9BRAS|nr:unnamed protein product [Microthlaspi erraticum]